MKPGSGTLVIDISGEKAEAYEGTYQCTAHNDHGTAVSNKIVIRQSSKISDFIHSRYFLSVNTDCLGLISFNSLTSFYIDISHIEMNEIHNVWTPWEACSTFV